MKLKKYKKLSVMLFLCVMFFVVTAFANKVNFNLSSAILNNINLGNVDMRPWAIYDPRILAMFL